MKNSKGDELLELSPELLELIDNFLDDYFTDVQAVIDFNNNFIEENSFAYKTEIDYMQLNRFTSAAYHTILANDPRVIDALMVKFYKDLVYLNNFYIDFVKNSKDITKIYKYQFLTHYKGLQSLANRLPSVKKGFRTMNKMDNLDNYVKKQFKIEFEHFLELYKKDLKNVVNTKHYYFDHLLWFRAKKSDAIREFFQDSIGDKSDIEDILSTKTFIKQYLKSVDTPNSNNKEWHEYLRNVIHIMD